MQEIRVSLSKSHAFAPASCAGLEGSGGACAVALLVGGCDGDPGRDEDTATGHEKSESYEGGILGIHSWECQLA